MPPRRWEKPAANHCCPPPTFPRSEACSSQTHDALSRLFKKGGISFRNAKDIRASLKRLEIGSSLSIPELLTICGMLENCARVKSYGRPEQSDTPGDSLTSMFDALEPLTGLSTEIRHCILSEEEISDDASPALETNPPVHEVFQR